MSDGDSAGAQRVYIPSTLRIVTSLVDTDQIPVLGGTAFAVTAALREAYAAGDDEELAEVAQRDAARASLRLLAIEGATSADTDAEDPASEPDESAAAAAAFARRRVVVVADVDEANPRPDLDAAVVKIAGAVSREQIVSVLVDGAEAEPVIARAIELIDAADLGDEDAELAIGDADDHDLAWFATQELPFLVELL
ncbi:DUF6912 family protein [Jongsikchunia kroppenstedtii]|uniref:DUF6912 family protein n=1 Tax=Jongsikchunia kroppenstedtii TaxID=1121721 RepID=UPI0003674CEE|nr:hypothetical protein [Jongsikchunia kroppenstedtii]